MPPEKDQTTENFTADPNTDDSSNNPSTDYSELESKFEAKFAEFETKILDTVNSTVNGVVTKFTKSQKPSKTEPQPEPPTVDNSALEALQKENESMKALLDQLQAKDAERDRKSFETEVRSQLITRLTANKYDEFDSALKVFLAIYPLSQFSEKNGVIYFGSGKDAKTIDTAVKDFHNEVGKRFVIPDLADGTGKDGSDPPTKGSEASNKKRSLAETTQQLKDGKLKLQF